MYSGARAASAARWETRSEDVSKCTTQPSVGIPTKIYTGWPAGIPDTHLQIHSPGGFQTPTFESIHPGPVSSAQLRGLRSFRTHKALADAAGRCVSNIPRLSPEFAVKLVERLGLPGVQGGKSLLNSAKGLSRWTSSRNPRSTRGQANRFPFSSSRPRRQLAYTGTRAAQQAKYYAPSHSILDRSAVHAVPVPAAPSPKRGTIDAPSRRLRRTI